MNTGSKGALPPWQRDIVAEQFDEAIAENFEIDHRRQIVERRDALSHF